MQYLAVTFLIKPVQSSVDSPGLKPNCRGEVVNAGRYMIRRHHSKILLSMGASAIGR